VHTILQRTTFAKFTKQICKKHKKKHLHFKTKMSTFLAIGMLDFGGKCVRRLPTAVQRAIDNGEDWVSMRKEEQVVLQVCDMFGVRKDEFDVLYSAKDNAWAVQYACAPSLTSRPSAWLSAAYKDAPHPNFLAAAAGALAGAALAVTFAGLQQEVARHHLERGVNDLTFVPYKLEEDGVFSVTGSNSSSVVANLAPGDTPPEVEQKLLAPLQHVCYNGRYLEFVRLPDVLDADDWLGHVCWFLIDAVRPLPNNLQEQLPRCADWVGVTSAQVCKVAMEDVGRAAFAGAMLGWHKGAAGLPRQWCEQLVLRKGRTSLTLIRLLNTLQTCLGVMN
jgi:hypothetical protein